VGRWTVQNRDGDCGSRWVCKCSCGTIRSVDGHHLRRALTQSCGCLQKEQSSARLRAQRITHGLSKTPEYRSWLAMLNRCNDPKNKQFKDYGGRGITVCRRWRKFETFLADMGRRASGLTLERRNNKLGYSPTNCKWADRFEQANNTRRSQLATFKGATKTVSQWARELGVNRRRLAGRLTRGLPFDIAIQETDYRSRSGRAARGLQGTNKPA